MAVLLPLNTPTKVINSVSVAAAGTTVVDVDPLLGLISSVTLQVLPGNVDGLVGKLTATLDGTNYNIFISEVGSSTNFTTPLLGPIKGLRLAVTNYSSEAITTTAWMAAE